MEKNADAWWGDWGAGKKVLHDFAVRVTSQVVVRAFANHKPLVPSHRKADPRHRKSDP